MKFDHVGIFVKSLAFGRTHLRKLLAIADESEEYHDDVLKVSIQFLYDESEICYELVAPNGDGNPVDPILSGKKNILNHTAYKVSDLDLQIAKCRANGCVQLGHPRNALAFNGARVVFFLTPLYFIIELIEEM